MTPVDLLDFTHSKKNIPSNYLSHHSVQATQIQSIKILKAYLLDFMVITNATIMMTAIFQLSLNTFMTTSSLNKAFNNLPFFSFTLNLLPLIFMSYFFFSYFFNHGQTWGMNVVKYRIEMKELNFKSSLVWAMFSSVFMITGGLSFLFTYSKMKNMNWGEFKVHDHLYTELMQERNFSPINLLDQSIETKEEEYFSNAA